MWKSPALGNLAFKPNELKGLIQIILEQIDLALSVDMPVTGITKPYQDTIVDSVPELSPAQREAWKSKFQEYPDESRLR